MHGEHSIRPNHRGPLFTIWVPAFAGMIELSQHTDIVYLLSSKLPTHRLHSDGKSRTYAADLHRTYTE